MVCGAEAELWHDVSRELWAEKVVNQTIRLAAVTTTAAPVTDGKVPVYQRVINLPTEVVPPIPPIVIQAISTVVVVVFVLLAFGIAHWLLKRRQRRLIGVLPTSADGSWLLVAYDWPQPESKGPSAGHTGRMPLEGIRSVSELIAGIVDYGSEAVDPEVSSQNIEVRYMDDHGVERRLGAHTSFFEVRTARMIRVTKKGESGERGGLMWGHRSRGHRRGGHRRVRSVLHDTVPEGDEGEEEDDDDITVISNVMPPRMTAMEATPPLVQMMPPPSTAEEGDTAPLSPAPPL